MLVDLKVKDFLAETKSTTPAPGGGSASALAGAVGAALTIMVGGLTVGNDKYKSVEDSAKSIMDKLEPILKRLESFVDEDTNAFNAVMLAYKLPKETDDEKSTRSKAIQEAMKGAAALPMSVAQDSYIVLTLAEKMLTIGNSNAASDAAVAGKLAYAAMWGAIYNVRINLGSIKDEEFKSTFKNEIATLLNNSKTAMSKLEKSADDVIGV